MAVTEVEQVERECERSKTEKKPAAPKKKLKGSGKKKAARSRKARKAASPAVVERIDDGAGLLRRLLTKKLRTELGNRLCQSMIDNAILGKANAVWALMKVLDRPEQKPAEAKRQGRSLAEIWEAEPRWEEASEQTAEVGAGGREPEG